MSLAHGSPDDTDDTDDTDELDPGDGRENWAKRNEIMNVSHNLSRLSASALLDPPDFSRRPSGQRTCVRRVRRQWIAFFRSADRPVMSFQSALLQLPYLS